MRHEHLHELGTLLYGERFTKFLAEALTRVGPRTVHEPHLSAWVRGLRPVPAWVGVQAKALVPVGIEDLQRRISGLTMTVLRTGFFDPEPRPAAGRLAKLRQPHPDDLPPDDGPPETD